MIDSTMRGSAATGRRRGARSRASSASGRRTYSGRTRVRRPRQPRAAAASASSATTAASSGHAETTCTAVAERRSQSRSAYGRPIPRQQRTPRSPPSARPPREVGRGGRRPRGIDRTRRQRCRCLRPTVEQRREHLAARGVHPGGDQGVRRAAASARTRVRERLERRDADHGAAVREGEALDGGDADPQAREGAGSGRDGVERHVRERQAARRRADRGYRPAGARAWGTSPVAACCPSSTGRRERPRRCPRGWWCRARG